MWQRVRIFLVLVCAFAFVSVLVPPSVSRDRLALQQAEAAPHSESSAPKPDSTYAQRIGSILSAEMGKPETQGSVPGVVAARNGRDVFSRNGASIMKPASLLKLLTTATAVLRFGPTHQFVTEVKGPQKDAGGMIHGSIALVGGGDPTLASAWYASQEFYRPGNNGKVKVFASNTPTIEQLAYEIAAAGIKQINGDVIADESIFDTWRWQHGWKASYQEHDNVEVGNMSGLTVNLGMTADGRDAAASPAELAASLLRDALKAKGVRVLGKVKLGRADASFKQIATAASPPLSQIVAWTNKWSMNYPAEILLKDLGAAFGGAGSTAAGIRVIQSTLGGQHISLAHLRMSDGSGLSEDDRVEPLTLLQVLKLMVGLQGDAGTALRNSLAVAGQPGTLLRRMTQAPTAGNLRGKTGMLEGVRGLAGWTRTSDGSMLCYVALFNNLKSAPAMTGVLDDMGRGFTLLPH